MLKKIPSTIFFLVFLLINPCLLLRSQAPVHKVLLEEFTTASCGNCPMMSANITNWHETNKNSSVLISLHQGSGVDAMSNTYSNTVFQAMHPTGGWFAPAIMIDRGIYPWVDSLPYLSCYKAWGSAATPGTDSIATRLGSEPAKVGLGISGSYNATTRSITATVNAKFVSNVPAGDWRINLILVEDSVIGYPGLGAFVGWDQHCYDPTWANANYPGKFNGTDIIGYPHRHVARASLLGSWGKQGVIPSIPVIGTNYSTVTNFVFDTAYKPSHLSLVAFISSYGAGKGQKYVINATEVPLTASFAIGINQPNTDDKTGAALENIYPDPANGLTKIIYSLSGSGKTEILLSNIYGQTMDVLNKSNSDEGEYECFFDASKYAKGIYFISLHTISGSFVKKIIIN